MGIITLLTDFGSFYPSVMKAVMLSIAPSASVIDITHDVPPGDIRTEYLKLSGGTSYCEWKGRARYYDLVTDERTEERAAWFYPQPTGSFADLKDYVAFYPSKMDGCWVGGEKVEAQEGDFYGGWVTSNIVGPFKGGAGTWGW